MNKKIKVDNDVDLRIFIISAFRYALGRSTYVVPTIASIIYKNRESLDDNTIILIIQEIEEAEDRNGLGMECDSTTWLNLKISLEEYMKKEYKKYFK